MANFYKVVTEAINDIDRHGLDSGVRLKNWLDRIAAAAVRTLTSQRRREAELKLALKSIYTKLVDRGGLVKLHPGVSLFTLKSLKPGLKIELDRRIMASANLIRLNRNVAIQRTLQRFSGWASSVPSGGNSASSKVDTKAEIRKTLTQLPFEERRVLIDQGHKLTSAISDIVATNGGAIAARWHSNWRQQNYAYREQHKNRDGDVFAVRGCWAFQDGLMNKGSGFTDEIEQPAELPYCRCRYQYFYNLRDLPEDMLTAKGKAELKRVRVS